MCGLQKSRPTTRLRPSAATQTEPLNTLQNCLLAIAGFTDTITGVDCIKRIRGHRLVFLPALIGASAAGLAFTNNILLTGYWPPTNEMLRQFSTNPDQNPGGWQGGNWEGRGFNIYSFFPEFPGSTFPVGVGDFTVDYQDTSEDWWRITDMIKPAAIITFSRGSTGPRWEVEKLQRNLTTWVDDYVFPFQPTPSPPDPTMVPNGIRESSLPMAKIVKNVAAANLGLTAYIDATGFGGGFLSEFIAYHGVWYRDMHNDPDDPFRCFMSGHIHVGTSVTTEVGKLASEVTLRTVISSLNGVVPEPGSFAALSIGALWLIARRRRRTL
jgi:hypothetical protein